MDRLEKISTASKTPIELAGLAIHARTHAHTHRNLMHGYTSEAHTPDRDQLLQLLMPNTEHLQHTLSFAAGRSKPHSLHMQCQSHALTSLNSSLTSYQILLKPGKGMQPGTYNMTGVRHQLIDQVLIAPKAQYTKLQWLICC